MRSLLLITLLVSGCYASHERGGPRDGGRDAPPIGADAVVPVDAFVPTDASVCGDPVAAVIEIPEGGGCREVVVPTEPVPGALSCPFGPGPIEGATIVIRNLHRDRLHVLVRSRADDGGGEICYARREACECVPGGGCASGGDIRLHGIGEVYDLDESSAAIVVLDNQARPGWLRACSPPR